MHKVLAVILARGGSKRIPKKNLKLIKNKSLVQITIEQAKSSKYISDIVVSTDDNEIKKISEISGSEVLNRPEEYRHDITTNEADNIILDILKKKESKGYFYDVIVLLYPTSPLRKVKYIDQTIEKIIVENYDSALTLVKDHSYLWKKRENNNEIYTINYDYNFRTPSAVHAYVQFRENKAVYAFTRDLIFKHKVRLGGHIGYVEMTPLESIDVDTEDDLELCRILYNLNSN